MRRITLSAALLAVAACASDEKTASVATAEAPAPAATEAPAAASLAPLSDSAIPKGECGMVLWTLDEDRPAPIFRYVVGKEADLVMGGKSVKLTRKDVSGATGFGVAEHQIFSDDKGVSITVNARFSLGFDGGSYLERAVVSVESGGGWKTVVPAAGIAGCRA